MTRILKFVIIKKLNQISPFLFAAFFLIIAVIFSFYFENDIGKSLNRNKLQKKVFKVESSMQSFIDIIIDNHHKGKPLLDIEELEFANQNNLIAFIVKDDSLIAWSNNKLSLNSFYKKNQSSENELSFQKVDNQYCLIKSNTIDDITILLLKPVYFDYPFTNEYLENGFNPHFYKAQNISVAFDINHYPIFNSNNSFLFSIVFNENKCENPFFNSIILFLYFLFFIFLISGINNLISENIKLFKWRILLFSGFFIALIFISRVFKIPNFIYNTSVFSPESFALNMLIPSLGHYSMIILLLFSLVIYLFSEYNNIKVLFENYSINAKILVSFLLIILSFFGIDFLFYTVKLLITNSSINFDILNPIKIDYLSVIAYLIIVFKIIILVLTLNIIVRLLKDSSIPKKNLLIIFIIAYLLHFILFSYLLGNIFYAYFILLIFLFAFIYYYPKRLKNSRLTSYVAQFLIISLAFNFYINRNTLEVEKDKRHAAVLDVSMNQNPEAEFAFNLIEKDIYKDSVFNSMFNQTQINYDSIINYIELNYFDKYDIWDKFEIQITICDQYQKLLIKPENFTIDCKTFFYESLLRYGELTKNNNLYFLEYGTGQTNYLGLFQFEANYDDYLIQYTIYIEINSKLKREGYSKLLTASGLDPFEKIQDYSLARYVDSIKVESYGNYVYSNSFSFQISKDSDYKYIDKKSYNHLIYKVSDNQYYILSKENTSLVNRFATFSYLFIFVIFIFILISLFFNKHIKIINFNFTYSSRLQLTIIGILLLAFFIIVAISSYYINFLNEEKNNENASDISSSLKIEFENKIGKDDFPGMHSVDYLKELSVKFSKVFNTDINLYDIDGDLISSTRPKVFDYNLMSLKINPLAYIQIIDQNLPYFIVVDNIGEMEFMSSYRPIVDKTGDIVAIINLPYFAKQSEQRKQITGFILTLLNVYTLIIIASLIIAIIVSSYITRPLQTLKNKMRAVNLGKTNELIDWNRDDEIGQLISEYNKMLKELENSAELLAQSERASAWKEMAKQVAHEIKNPLTPMRLHIQYVQKLYGTESFEEKFKSMTSNLIQQIDALAEIATAFSDFAKMPRFENHKINLNQIIRSAAELNQNDKVEIILNFDSNKDFFIKSDQKQMLRVFNNLITNSIQASKEDEIQKISIDINEDDNHYKIVFKDYGIGIPEDKKEKIFVPNFTTKSHGMGMGLAIVKSIIISSGGNIAFESQLNKGTTFYIELPKYK